MTADPASTYVCLDVEVDGEAPGLGSMLSLAAAVVRDHAISETFSANLETLPAAAPHPETMAFWARFPDEFEATRIDKRLPDEAIPEFVNWLDGLSSEPLVAVGAPAACDFAWVNWYCHRFAGRNPLGYACLDLLSFAMGLLRASDYWALEHQLDRVLQVPAYPALRRHVAIDDAVLTARTLIAVLEERDRLAADAVVIVNSQAKP